MNDEEIRMELKRYAAKDYLRPDEKWRYALLKKEMRRRRQEQEKIRVHRYSAKTYGGGNAK